MKPNNQSNTGEFIIKAKMIHGDKYDYSSVNYVKAIIKVQIECNKHGFFSQSPNSHLRGRGCPKCANEIIAKKLIYSLDEYIDKAKKIHNNFFNYDKVVYNGAKIKVKIICPYHGEFEQNPHSHLQKAGCKKCFYLTVKNRFSSNIDEFINKANKIHSGVYNYSKFIYLGSNKKGIIKCNIHGEFLQVPSSHLQGVGCPKCGLENKIIHNKLTIQQFLDKVIKVHGTKYDYSKVEYIRAIDKVCIICPIHGDFWQRPNDHISGKQGCMKCSGRNSHTLETFVNLSRKRHGNKYDYSKVEYKGNKNHVIIICPLHGEFKQQPKKHMYENGCPKCLCSFGEIAISEFLLKNNTKFESQKMFNGCKSPLKFGRRLPFDFYLPDYNLCIEYDGEQHYKPVIFKNMNQQQAEINFQRVKVNDQIKTDYCKTKEIKLLRISYTEFKRIDEILKQNID